MYNDYGAKEVAQIGVSENKVALLDELNFRRRKVLTELDDLNKAIELLELHPEVEQVMTALKKIGRY